MNFLPIENQIIFKKKYKQKFLIILGCVITFLLLTNLILALSYYLFLKIKSGDISTQINALNNSNVFKKSFNESKQLKELNSKADFLDKKLKGGKNISLILEKILITRGQDPISIDSISFNREIEGSISPKNTLILKGEAETRISFLRFIKNLEKESDLFEVQLNPNNFLKEKKISYSLEIFIK